MPNEPEGGTFYLSGSYPDGYEVLVHGVVRTDYIKITDGKGNPGVFFAKITYDEKCNLQVKSLTPRRD